MAENITKKLICIRCPRGCEIQTSLDGYGSIVSIEGNFCKLGIDYANNEIKDPRRTVTTTVRVKNGVYPLVSVWTTNPIPKDRIMDLLVLLKKIELEAPVELSRIVLKNIFGLGIDVVTSGKTERLA